MPNHAWSKVRSFVVYYGDPVYAQGGAEAVIRTLSGCDAAIIEPSCYDVEWLRRIQASGTLLLAYVPVMESPEWNKARMDCLQDKHYLRNSHGQKLVQQAWRSYVMDLRQPSYRDVLLQELARWASLGFDGFFLDTVGDIEELVSSNQQRHELHHAYRELLHTAATQFPQALLVQNRGFGTLSYVGSLLHGIVWEDWQGDRVHEPWMALTISKTQAWAKDHRKRGCKVLALSTRVLQADRSAADRLGFVHTAQPQGYNTL